jgi:hypothetical protein
MQAHEFDWSKESVEALDASVAEELQGKEVKELEQKLDDDLVKFFNIKGARRISFYSIVS